MSEQPATPSGKVVAKSAIWYTASTFVTRSLAFITIPIFIRIMTVEDFGTFNALAAVMVLSVAVLGFEAHQTINRARFDFTNRELLGYQLSLLTLTLGIASLACVSVVAWPELARTVTGIDADHLLVMLIYVGLYPAFSLFQAFQRVRYRYRLAASIAFVTSIAATCLSIILVLRLDDPLMGRLAGYYLPFAVVGLCFFTYYIGAGGRLKIKFLRYGLVLGLPLMVAAVGTQGMLLGSRIVVYAMESPEATALVALATSVANIAVIFFTVLNQAWSPWFLDCLRAGNHGLARRTYLPFLIVIVVVVAVSSLLAPEVVFVLGGTAYAEAAPLVPSFMCAALLGAILMQYTFIQTFHKSVVAGSLLTLMAAVLNAAACVVGVMVWGFESVGYISVVCYLVLIWAQKRNVARFGASDIFTWKMLLLAVGGSLLVGLVSLLLMGTGLDAVRYMCAGLGALSGLYFLREARRGLVRTDV